MTKIGFWLFLKPLSFLPLPVMYFVTWPFFFLVAYVIKYREKIIVNNMRNSFPDKSEKEIQSLKMKFYRHFCDQIIESLKMFSISEKEATKRMKLVNPEVFEEVFKTGRSVALMLGHYNNWEFTSFINNRISHKFTAIYAGLRNKDMDALIKESRSFAGSEMVKKNDLKGFIRRKNPDPFVLAFVGDQSPSMSGKVYWTTFLNQESGFAMGAERYGKLLNMPVVFQKLEKVKRGHYRLTLEMIEANPKEANAGEVIEKYVRLLEDQINEAPEFWLWSHKRWKRKRPVEG